ncbi:MAG: hypothetical protein KOO66_09645 [Bacteroidales bacterium]|nr:hypothetical protein [Bacteroidales bacterium]
MKQLKFILIIILTFIAINLFGQSQLIILNDSSLIHGEILNYYHYDIIVKINDEVKIINKNEILDIYKAKHKVSFEDKIKINFKEKSKDSNKVGMTSSYFNISDIGMLAGKRDGYKKYSLSFNMINGVQLNEKASVGLGFGIEFMDIQLIPLFGDLRWNLNKGNTQVFIGMQGGFLFPLERNDNEMEWDDYNYKRGYFYNPVIGLKANFKNSRNAFVITCGFRHMKIMGERFDDWWLETKYEREFIYDRFSFRVGYYFN